ncbi:MAG: hypothetical protein K2X38_03250 [Gemmataceae bacterium]|nr:hypothetical protein [Gemmataceae bacterium]
MAEEAKSPMELFIAALVCGASVEAAARKAGISRRTAFRRLKDQRVVQRLKTARLEVVKRAAGLLAAGSLEAVKTLMELLAPGVAPATRLGAARAIIELGVKLRESGEMEERLAALEAQLAAKGKASRVRADPSTN